MTNPEKTLEILRTDSAILRAKLEIQIRYEYDLRRLFETARDSVELTKKQLQSIQKLSENILNQ